VHSASHLAASCVTPSLCWQHRLELIVAAVGCCGMLEGLLEPCQPDWAKASACKVRTQDVCRMAQWQLGRVRVSLRKSRLCLVHLNAWVCRPLNSLHVAHGHQVCNV
jgi:hypothetical protein